MFYLWMKILLILIIIAIGLLVVKKSKGTAEATMASTASFVMLFAIAALYLFLVVALQQADLLFWLVAAAIVFPFLTYVVVFASVKNAHHAEAARTTRSATAKTVRPAVATPVARKATKAPHRTAKKALAGKPEPAPSAHGRSLIATVPAESTHTTELNFQPLETDGYEFTEQAETIEEPPRMEEAITESQPARLQPLVAPQENQVETEHERKPMRAYQPTRFPRPAYSGRTALESHRIDHPVPGPAQAGQSGISAPEASTASPAPKPLRPLFAEATEQPATAPVHMKPPQPEQPKPRSTNLEQAESNTVADAPEQEPVFDSFADCCSKAQTLRTKGLYSTAGTLYERAAAMKAGEADSYKALFNALSCYVKANKSAEACAVAQHLSTHVEDLQPAETAKLSAMLSYLQRRLKQ